MNIIYLVIGIFGIVAAIIPGPGDCTLINTSLCLTSILCFLVYFKGKE